MNRPENVDFVLKDIRSNILDSYVNSLENRIDKAIEYIEEYKEEGMGEEWFRSSTPVSNLLNILKGEE